jgi:hypothetical protein
VKAESDDKEAEVKDQKLLDGVTRMLGTLFDAFFDVEHVDTLDEDRLKKLTSSLLERANEADVPEYIAKLALSTFHCKLCIHEEAMKQCKELRNFNNSTTFSISVLKSGNRHLAQGSRNGFLRILMKTKVFLTWLTSVRVETSDLEKSGNFRFTVGASTHMLDTQQTTPFMWQIVTASEQNPPKMGPESSFHLRPPFKTLVLVDNQLPSFTINALELGNESTWLTPRTHFLQPLKGTSLETAVAEDYLHCWRTYILSEKARDLRKYGRPKLELPYKLADEVTAEELPIIVWMKAEARSGGPEPGAASSGGADPARAAVQLHPRRPQNVVLKRRRR